MNLRRLYVRAKSSVERRGIHNIPGVKSLFQFLDSILLDQDGKYRTHPDTHEYRVQSAFLKHCNKGDTIVEIGGFHGSHTINLSLIVGESGRVVVFEPHPKHAKLIKDRMTENDIFNVTVKEKAAAGNDGKVELWVDKEDSSTSSIATSHKNGEYRQVESVRIGDYIGRALSGSADLCKVDIEGGEYEMIMDSSLLHHVQTLILEIHPQFIGVEKAEEIILELKKYGSITDIDGNDITKKEITHESTEHIIWKNNNI